MEGRPQDESITTKKMGGTKQVNRQYIQLSFILSPHYYYFYPQTIFTIQYYKQIFEHFEQMQVNTFRKSSHVDNDSREE